YAKTTQEEKDKEPVKYFEPAFRLQDQAGDKVMMQKEVKKAINGVAWSPDTKLIAVADEEGHVGVWDLSKKEFRRKKVSEKPLTSIAFSDDGKGLLVGDAGGEASVWFSDLSGPRQRCRPPKQRELPLKRVLFGDREREVLTCAEKAVVSRYKADN